MAKEFLSKRVKKRSQSEITSDRYEFLSLNQAEPDLGDPLVGPSSVIANPFGGNLNEIYFLGADSSGTGKRYWLDQSSIVAASSVEGISVRENGILVGSAGSIKILDFVGDVAIAATINSGVATVTFSPDLINYANFSGIATYASTAGIATYASTAGIATNATYATSSGIATYATSSGIATYATSSGIATYASTAGIATNIKGGSFGDIPYQSSANTTAFITASSASPGQVVLWDNSGPYWGNVTAASGSFGGITIRNEGSIVGTSDSITTVNFVGSNVNVTATTGGNGIATVTVANGIATSFETARTFQITGDVVASAISFDGTGNVSLAATIQPNSVGLGTDTTGNYVTSITNGSYITGGDGGSEGAALTLAVDATSTNTVSKVVARDSSGNFSAGTITASLSGNASSSTYATSAGIATYASTAGVSTALQNARTFEITGDVVASAISFDGTGNVSLAATIQPNSIALGTDTTGDYVTNITGTSNQITVTSGTGEGSTPTLSIPSQFTAPQDVTVTRDLQVNRNLNVTGNITIGGTSATLFSQELKVFDPDIVLGFRTDGSGNDVSTDNTANHGGIAIASTEGTPLISLYDVGIGETNPATYKKFMWFKSGTFTGLGTDAWLSNYAIGIGSTQVPNGVRLAVGNVKITENDLSVVRNINASGVITATSFVGIVTYASTAGIATYASAAGIAGIATSVIGGIASVTQLNVSGITTVGFLTATNIWNAGVTTSSSFVKSGGTSLQFLKADGSVDSNVYATDSPSFYTGITTSIYVSVTSGVGTNTTQTNDIFAGPGIAGTTIGIAYSFPSTAGKKYVIESIHLTNTFSDDVYFVGRQDYSGGSAVPIAQRIIIPYQGALELLESQIVANPSDILRFQALSGVGTTAVGLDGALDAFVVYSEKNNTNYIGTGKTVTNSSGTEIFQASTYPAMVQSIKICNYNMNIDVDASVSIYRGGTSGNVVATGVRQGYLAYNVTVPKNSVIEIIGKSKYLAVNDSIVGGASTANSVSITVSGKYIS
jgi:hypothetical protein